MINFPTRTDAEFTKIENEANRWRLIEAGPCQAEVLSTTFGPNKKGIEMLTVNYKISDKTGKSNFVRDWLMYDENSEYKHFQEKKIREFCKAFNLDLQKGILDSSLNIDGLVCEVIVGIKANSFRDNAEENVISKYLKKPDYVVTNVYEKTNQSNEDIDTDGDIPF